MTERKPFNKDAGYKCSLRTPFGWCVVYDRHTGGNWIDADTRWVVAAYDAKRNNIGLLECTSERIARDTMKDAAAGEHDWIDPTMLPAKLLRITPPEELPPLPEWPPAEERDMTTAKPPVQTDAALITPGGRLTALDIEDIRGSVAKNTGKAYTFALGKLDAWLQARGRELTDESLRDYLHAMNGEGKAPSSCAQLVAAADFRARVNGTPSPVGERSRRALKRIRREGVARGRGQADPLTVEDVGAILAVACQPRPRGRGMESATEAEKRGKLDAALVGTMFHGGLRRSEAAALCWGDIRPAADIPGAVLLHIRTSKTNPTGDRKDLRLVKNSCAAALEAIRPPDAAPTDSVFGLSVNSISRRFIAAAKAAGIAGRITPHSARVGLATELTRRGASTTEVMLAGGWTSARMVAHYSASIHAEQGAVAKYL